MLHGFPALAKKQWLGGVEAQRQQNTRAWWSAAEERRASKDARQKGRTALEHEFAKETMDYEARGREEEEQARQIVERDGRMKHHRSREDMLIVGKDAFDQAYQARIEESQHMIQERKAAWEKDTAEEQEWLESKRKDWEAAA